MERLQRVLSTRGVESRRNAEALIRAGRVAVDGEVVTELGTKVDPRHARIEVDGKVLRPQRMRYILLNKPMGFITTTDDERGRHTVMELVQLPERIYPVGRLDRDTEGLLLLTNDGDVANRVMHPRYGLSKEYNVLTNRRPIEPVMERVRRGLVVDGKKVVPEEFRILRETRDGILLTITIHEGTKHVVRRIMEAARIHVTRLRRVRIGPLSIAGIREGTYRELTPGELTTLFQALRIEDAEERAVSTPSSWVESGGRPPAGGSRSRAAETTTGNSGKQSAKPTDRRRSAPQLGPVDDAAPHRHSRSKPPTAAEADRDGRSTRGSRRDEHGSRPSRGAPPSAGKRHAPAKPGTPARPPEVSRPPGEGSDENRQRSAPPTRRHDAASDQGRPRRAPSGPGRPSRGSTAHDKDASRGTRKGGSNPSGGRSGKGKPPAAPKRNNRGRDD